MRLSRLIPSLMALSALAACATHSPAPSAEMTTAAGAPAAAAGLDWFMNRDGQEASLAYGVANSDEMKLSLLCRAGSGALEITAASEKPARQIHLESGGDTERYAATSEPAVVHEGELLTARAKASDPVFLRFRRLGWIAAWADDERQFYVAHPAAKAGVEQFFAVCG
ncbi:hypothetical protein SH203_00993 [Brevundimonas sp. SH203]|uniref:hypothetical protein n=1 Tax=Brevundimonas sp. SH203 TaxID=345167 RepID=UPI0009D30257|nr:hypothetical protein [Brevundimonas sp. SH203]GAW40594.1 hypothetical protein SH203_00993 [Brevundimonas sp. SH203]